MRKFFKSLAVLLALTLIVGVIPASAAVNLTMDSEKTLYLDGSKGAKEDGAKCKISYKKKVANMIKNFDADTMTVALKSEDKSIVSTTKAGRIVAKSLGTTTVVVTVYNADEEQIFQQDLKVKVKKNATDVTVTGIADGDKFKVGESVDVTLPRAGVDTDERELTVDKTDVASVTAGAKSRTYTVKFLKGGEATFTAKAYQSTKYPAATATKTIKVTVGNPAPTSVKAVAANAYELTFDTNVADVFKSNKDIADDAVYYLSNDVKIPFTGIKEVKTTDNVVKVTMFNNFTSGTTYYVVVNGCDPLSFSVAGTAAKDVTAIVINTATLIKDKDTDVSVSLFNKDGVEITSSVGTNDIALSSSDNLKLWPQGGLKATMYNVGDSADLTATFTYYDPNNNYEATVIKITKNITCVAAPVAQKTGLIYTLGGSKNNPKNYIALGETLTFNAWLKETLNGNTVEKLVGDPAQPFANLGATYAKIADTSVAMITADDNAGNYSVKGNQTGNTYVFICYTDANNKEQILDSCPIEVRAARFAQTVTLSLNKSNLNYDEATDSVKITAKVADNYQDPIAVVPTWTQLDASKAKGTLNAKNFVPTSTFGTYELELKAADFAAYAADGAIVITVQAGDKSNKPNATFNVAKKGNVASGYNFTIDKSAIDTSINALKTGIVKATVSLTAVKDGYFVAKQAFDGNDALNGAATPTNATAASYGAFVLDIKKDGKALNIHTAVPNGNCNYDDLIVVKNDGTIEVSSYYAASTSSAITKLPTGNYAFELYIIKGGKIDGSVRRATLTVSDKQVKPTFTKVEQSVAKKGAIADCFEFKFDNNKQTTVSVAPANYVTYNKDKAGNTTSIFVAKADVALAISDGNGVATGVYIITVDVNTLLDP